MDRYLQSLLQGKQIRASRFEWRHASAMYRMWVLVYVTAPVYAILQQRQCMHSSWLEQLQDTIYDLCRKREAQHVLFRYRICKHFNNVLDVIESVVTQDRLGIHSGIECLQLSHSTNNFVQAITQKPDCCHTSIINCFMYSDTLMYSDRYGNGYEYCQFSFGSVLRTYHTLLSHFTVIITDYYVHGCVLS